MTTTTTHNATTILFLYGVDPTTGGNYLPDATKSPAGIARGMGIYQLVGVLADIDLFEVNEAFGGVPLMFQQEFGIPDDRLNVNGGSVAIGHPLGSTGARMLTDLLCELERRGGRYGLQTICEASGTANTTIIERLA